MSITETDKKYVAGTYARFPVELVSGKGAILKDSSGKEYIDLGSGIAVNIFGVADDEWQKAVTAQLSVLPHTIPSYLGAISSHRTSKTPPTYVSDISLVILF